MGSAPIFGCNGNGKMAIMATGCNVHTSVTMENKKRFYLNCHSHHSVNEPLVTSFISCNMITNAVLI